MEIRHYQDADAYSLWQLHHETIHAYCCKDYDAQQINAWSPAHYDESVWAKRMLAINPFIAISNGVIAGYADLQHDGYIDHFYCHKDFIGKGVGGLLMRHILAQAREANISKLHSHVSLSAKGFFSYFGFNVLFEQQVEVRGIYLTNFGMELILDTR